MRTKRELPERLAANPSVPGTRRDRCARPRRPARRRVEWTTGLPALAALAWLLAPLGSTARAEEATPAPQTAAPQADLPQDVQPASDTASAQAAAAIDARSRALFDTHVRPILQKRCLRCHGPIRRKSELDLRTPESVLLGGEGGPAVVPGRPEESPLWQLVQPDADPHMPPGKEQLDASEIAILAAWIHRLAGSESGWQAPRAAASASTDDPLAVSWRPPAGITPRVVIDLLIERRWREAGVTPSPPADDRAFVRRVWLDLIGRIPTPEEVDAFLAETSSDKRQRLVDRLLESPEHARHLAEVFDVVLVGRADERRRERRRGLGWDDWLVDVFRRNRPWNEVVEELLLARSASDADRGATVFLLDRKNDHQAMAEAVAPALLGVEIQCAQCHDHPLAPEILQKHYWGLVSFFSRSKVTDTSRGPALGESAIGGFGKFADLQGHDHEASLVFFDGTVVPEERPAPDAKELDSADKYLVPPVAEGTPDAAPVPKTSRRARLAELASSSELSARALVNRIWALLLGRGLVHPVDRMDSFHPPSHPALLDWLTEDFRAGGHDVRRLIREIVSSRVYQLDARPADGAARPPDDSLFARSLERPLPAEALYRSMLVATGNLGLEGGAPQTPPERLLEEFPRVFHDDYSATLKQALFVSNSPAIAEVVRARSGSAVARVAALTDTEEAVGAAFRRAFGRAPDAEELARARGFLEERADRRESATEQLFWALLASPEFRFNR